MAITTYLQIDLQYLFFEARNKGHRLDLEIIKDYFNERGNEFLTDSKVYMIRGADFNSSKFEAKLKSIGYSLCVKTGTKSMDTAEAYQQACLNLTIDAIDHMDSYKTWILMSGNGIFTDLCAHLKKKKKKIEIWSFKESFDSGLEMYADKIHFIPSRFYLRKPRITVFGFHTDRAMK